MSSPSGSGWRLDLEQANLALRMAGIESRSGSMGEVIAMIDKHPERIAPRLTDRLVG